MARRSSEISDRVDLIFHRLNLSRPELINIQGFRKLSSEEIFDRDRNSYKEKVTQS